MSDKNNNPKFRILVTTAVPVVTTAVPVVTTAVPVVTSPVPVVTTPPPLDCSLLTNQITFLQDFLDDLTSTIALIDEAITWKANEEKPKIANDQLLSTIQQLNILSASLTANNANKTDLKSNIKNSNQDANIIKTVNHIYTNANQMFLARYEQKTLQDCLLNLKNARHKDLPNNDLRTAKAGLKELEGLRDRFALNLSTLINFNNTSCP